MVIIDADTTIDAHLLRSFDKALRRGHDWIQAYYTVANPDQSWRTRLMTYAFSLFNGVMQLGQNALGCERGLQGQRNVLFDPRSAAAAVAVLRAGRRHGVLVDDPGRRRERSGSCPTRQFTARCWARAARRRPTSAGAGSSAASKSAKSYLGPLLRSNDLGWCEKVVSVCELTIPSHGGLAIVYLVVIGIDAFTYFCARRPAVYGRASIFARFQRRHDRRSGLCGIAVSGDAAPPEVCLRASCFSRST